MIFQDKTLLIEGWRGVNHSYALINQHQILAMHRLAGLKLFHHDLPFAFTHWDATRNDSGFSPDDRSALDTLHGPEPCSDAVDGLYRICSPFRTVGAAGFARHRTTTFMITELGLAPESFAPGDDRSPFFTRDDNIIVTSTNWSRDRIIEYGFEQDRVKTIPLGVDTEIFSPIWPDARARGRAALGVAEDETMFLNIGPPLWNKGIDALLQAFAILRLQGLKVQLIVKDQQNVYGISLNGIIETLSISIPALNTDLVRSGITTVPMNLAPKQLATLFGLSDCYVSPYRAEGFNLPVLEAISCGIPTIVTAGGATDDFCNDDTSLRIHGRFHRKNADAGLIGAYIEPNPDALVDAMSVIVNGWRPDRTKFDAARQSILQHFSWRNAAEQTACLSLL